MDESAWACGMGMMKGCRIGQDRVGYERTDNDWDWDRDGFE